MIKFITPLFVLSVIVCTLNAQNIIRTVPEHHRINSDKHTSIIEFNPYAFKEYADSLIQSHQSHSNFAQNNWLGRKLFNENLVHVKKDEYNIILNPLIDFSIGNDNNLNNLTYINRRGVQVKGNITEKFSYYTDFLETQQLFPLYVSNIIDSLNVIPGQGPFKQFGDNGAKDFGISSSFLDFRPNKFFEIQFGRGKNFIGDGYRSLLLSGNPFNYPYLRLTLNIWKLKYIVLYSQQKDINNRYSDGTFVNKYTTAHYLSYNVSKRWNIGLFEAVTYADEDRTRGYDISYLNPIIFYRPIEFALGTVGGNVIIGLNTKYRITNNINAYAQLALDELNTERLFEGNGWWANKFAWQIGLKSFNTFTPNLTIQSEVNFARPFIYSHTNELQNFANYNQSLTHPLGANFIESVSIVQYRHKRLFARFEFLYAQQGLNPPGINLGSDIIKSNTTRFQDFNNSFLQGDLATNIFIDAKVGYIINPNYNFVFEIGITNRNYEVENRPSENINTSHIYAGLKTDLFQYYYDF